MNNPYILILNKKHHAVGEFFLLPILQSRLCLSHSIDSKWKIPRFAYFYSLLWLFSSLTETGRGGAVC